MRAFGANEKICLIFSERTVDRGHVKVTKKSFVSLTIDAMQCYPVGDDFSYGQSFGANEKLFSPASRRNAQTLALVLFTYVHKTISPLLVHHSLLSMSVAEIESSHLFRKICLQYFICLDALVPLKCFMGQLSCRSQAHSSVQVLSASSVLIIYLYVLSMPININFCVE